MNIFLINNNQYKIRKTKQEENCLRSVEFPRMTVNTVKYSCLYTSERERESRGNFGERASLSRAGQEAKGVRVIESTLQTLRRAYNELSRICIQWRGKPFNRNDLCVYDKRHVYVPER